MAQMPFPTQALKFSHIELSFVLPSVDFGLAYAPFSALSQPLSRTFEEGFRADNIRRRYPHRCVLT